MSAGLPGFGPIGAAPLGSTGGAVVNTAFLAFSSSSALLIPRQIGKVLGGASGPPAATPHRYWRIYAYTVNVTNYALKELEMHTSVGGAQVCTGGTAISSGDVGGYPASLAFDGSLSTDPWVASPAGGNVWIGYDFGAGNVKAISEISICSWAEDGLVHFSLDYSDDGATWATLFDVPDAIGAGWTNSTWRAFSAPVLPPSGGFVTTSALTLATSRIFNRALAIASASLLTLNRGAGRLLAFSGLSTLAIKRSASTGLLIASSSILAPKRGVVMGLTALTASAIGVLTEVLSGVRVIAQAIAIATASALSSSRHAAKVLAVQSPSTLKTTRRMDIVRTALTTSGLVLAALFSAGAQVFAQVIAIVASSAIALNRAAGVTQSAETLSSIALQRGATKTEGIASLSALQSHKWIVKALKATTAGVIASARSIATTILVSVRSAVRLMFGRVVPEIQEIAGKAAHGFMTGKAAFWRLIGKATKGRL